jgi:hypothetical protein
MLQDPVPDPLHEFALMRFECKEWFRGIVPSESLSARGLQFCLLDEHCSCAGLSFKMSRSCRMLHAPVRQQDRSWFEATWLDDVLREWLHEWPSGLRRTPAEPESILWQLHGMSPGVELQTSAPMPNSTDSSA